MLNGLLPKDRLGLIELVFKERWEFNVGIKPHEELIAF